MPKLLKFEHVATLTTATSLGEPTEGGGISEAYSALIQCLGQPVNWRGDGTDPTAAIGGGMQLAVGQTLEYEGDLEKLRFIETAVGGKLNVHYFGAT